MAHQKHYGRTRAERSKITAQQYGHYYSYLLCLYYHFYARYTWLYFAQAKRAPALWCVTHNDHAKLARAGQAIKFAHQPPPLASVRRDAMARVYTLLCTCYRELREAPERDLEKLHGAQAMTKRIQALATQLTAMAEPYMQADRRVLGHDAWLRQLTRGRVYKQAAHDLLRLLDEYHLHGGEVSNHNQVVMTYNDLGQRLDDAWKEKSIYDTRQAANAQCQSAEKATWQGPLAC